MRGEGRELFLQWLHLKGAKRHLCQETVAASCPHGVKFKYKIKWHRCLRSVYVNKTLGEDDLEGEPV